MASDTKEESAEDASKPEVPRHISMAMWNCGTGLTNPFEFWQHQEPLASTLEGPALCFGKLISDVLEDTLDVEQRGRAAQRSEAKLASLCVSATEMLKEMSCVDVILPLQTLAISYPLAGKIWKIATGTSVPDFLRAIRKGDRSVSRVASTLDKQVWSLWKLSQNTSGSIIRTIWGGDVTGFFKGWLEGMMRVFPEASQDPKLPPKVLPLSVLEGIVATVAVHLCDSGSEIFGNVDRLASSVAAVCASIGALQSSKCLGIARVLQVVDQHYCPDIIFLQAFNVTWLQDPGFQAFWRFMEQEHVYCQIHQEEKYEHKGCKIFARSGTGMPLTFNKHLTSVCKRLEFEDGFLDQLKKVYQNVFGDQADAMMDLAALGEDALTKRSLVMAVCDLNFPFVKKAAQADKDGAEETKAPQHLLLACCQADEKGVGSKAMVLLCKVLAEQQGFDLLMSIDIRCPTGVGTEDGCSQADFLDFLRSVDVRHCFGHQGDDVVANAERFHTMRRKRTFFQYSLELAGQEEMAGQDFILGFGHGFQSLTGWRGNIPSGLASTNPEGSASEQESLTWNNELCMPTPEFSSDHAVILARAYQ